MKLKNVNKKQLYKNLKGDQKKACTFFYGKKSE